MFEAKGEYQPLIMAAIEEEAVCLELTQRKSCRTAGSTGWLSKKDPKGK